MALLGILAVGQVSVWGEFLHQAAWETCVWVDGKGGDCRAGDQARPFAEFLVPGAWADVRDSFTDEFRWDKKRLEAGLKVTWVEVGRLGAHRVRTVQFASLGEPFASILLAESTAGIFAPLLKWAGQMPTAVIYEPAGTQVLQVAKDYGGFGPMVSTWAWMLGERGPVRLDVSRALAETIDRVAPGYKGYDTGLDWETLRFGTGVWTGPYLCKACVGAGASGWFELDEDGLFLRRADFQKDGDPTSARSWPPTYFEFEAMSTGDPLARPNACATTAGDMRAVTVCTLRRLPVLRKYEASSYRRQHSQAVADLDRPIRAWIRGARDPYERGLAALYEQRAGDAALELRLALRQFDQVGGDREKAATAALFLGQARFAQQKFALAVVALRRSIQLNSRDSVAWSSLGHALHALWDYAGAETAFRRALEIEEKVYGADAAATAAGLSEVARLVYMRGELGAWESLLRRRLRIVEQRWGTESAEYAEALFDLASTDERKGDWPSAESAFRQVLRIRQRLLGPRHPESLDATDRLGYIAYQTSKCSEAIPLLRDSVAQRERAVGPAHPGLAASWHILGLCLERLGNLPAAAEQYENAASLVEETLGKDELSLAVYTSSLAGVLAKPDGPETRYVSRALLSRQALRIYERVLPAEHPDLAGPLTSLAASLGVQHKESESLLRRALAIEEKTPGPFQLHATRILNELAALWIYREQDASAEPLLRRALAIQEKKLSPDPLETARSLHLLAGVLARKGDYHSALPLIERALAIRERLLIAGHTDIQESRWLLMDIRGKAARPRP